MRIKLVVFFLSLLMLAPVAQAQNAMEFFGRDGSKNSTIDYRHYEGFMTQYAKSFNNGIIGFDYANIPIAGRNMIKKQIADLQSIIITQYTKEAQLAYWINLYNMITLDMALSNYPIKSIRDVKDVWKRKSVTVQGQELSLDDIEHKIIRPLHNDFRIHAALNVASLSSGNLPKKAYGKNINQELDTAMREWVARDSTFNIQGKNITISEVFKWYKEDFGNGQEAILDRVSKYLPEDKQNVFNNTENKKIRYAYDWALNNTKK